ncbi:hypothetical protein AB0L10_15435 [Streptomyces flaveolus]|uniref:hypothetical protein n=1 Tax=Streptomyces flaveolus TaxID=67297 RepID=UPI00342FABAE
MDYDGAEKFMVYERAAVVLAERLGIPLAYTTGIDVHPITARSPLVCGGRRSHSDSAFYTAASGAGVFATGTMRWVEALMAGAPDGGRDHGMDARTRTFVTRTTENALRAFAKGPAAHHRPAARPNVSEAYKTRT